jgi:hypothetical protein
VEVLTLLVSSLIGLVSPTGVVVDRVAESQIRKRFVAVEQLAVRVDNRPSHQLINGKVERIRIAGRGLFPVKGLRIDRLEVETDPISVHLRNGKLKQPLQAVTRIVLTEKDLNQALQSPAVTSRLRNLNIRLLQRRTTQANRYDVLNLNVIFLPDNRIRLHGELYEQGYPDTLKIVAEATPKIIQGRSLYLDNLKITANGQPTPETISRAIAQRVADRFDLRQLERSNTTARILKLTIEPSRMDISAFAQIRPPVEK